MLTITIQEELWDDDAEIFRYLDVATLEFEHSLVSLSKWESRFHKPFLTPDKKTPEEMIGYFEAMLVTTEYAPQLMSLLDEDHLEQIDAYINNPMTGTTVSNLPQNQSRSSERISAELIYFWMSQYQISMECERWHLNRLFTLIKVHHAKTQKPQKMSQQSNAQRMAELNAQRKAQLGTKG